MSAASTVEAAQNRWVLTPRNREDEKTAWDALWVAAVGERPADAVPLPEVWA